MQFKKVHVSLCPTTRYTSPPLILVFLAFFMLMASVLASVDSSYLSSLALYFLSGIASFFVGVLLVIVWRGPCSTSCSRVLIVDLQMSVLPLIQQSRFHWSLPFWCINLCTGGPTVLWHFFSVNYLRQNRWLLR